MIKRLLPLLLLILIGCSEPEPINMDEMLIERNDVYYTKDTNQPYSGPVFKLYHDIGRIKEQGYLENGMKTGLLIEYFPTQSQEKGSIRSEFNYTNGKKNGIYKVYYDDGIIYKSGSYKDGKLDGLIKTYYIEGTLEYDNFSIGKHEKTYKDGKLHGLLRIYSGDGTLKQERTYKNDKLEGPFKDYFLGELQEEGTYKNGKKDGPYKLFHYLSNGELQEEGTYKDDLRDGPFKSYHDNGQLKSDGNYYMGKKNGFVKSFNSKGQIQWENFYRNGYWKEQKEFVYDNKDKLYLSRKWYSDSREQIKTSFIYNSSGQVQREITTYDIDSSKNTTKYYKYNDDGKLEFYQTIQNGRTIDYKEY